MVMLSQRHSTELIQSLNTCFLTFVKKADNDSQQWSLTKSIRFILLVHSIQPDNFRQETEKILGDVVDRLIKITNYSDVESSHSNHTLELVSIKKVIFDQKLSLNFQMQLTKFILHDRILIDHRLMDEIHKIGKSGDIPKHLQYERLLDAIQNLIHNCSEPNLTKVRYYYSGKAVEANYGLLKEIYSNINANEIVEFGKIFRNQSLVSIEDYLSMLAKTKGDHVDVLTKHKFTEGIRLILTSDLSDQIPNLYRELNHAYSIFTLLIEKQPRLDALYHSFSQLIGQLGVSSLEDMGSSSTTYLLDELYNRHIILVIKSEWESLERYQAQVKSHLNNLERFVSFLTNFVSFLFSLLAIAYVLAVDHSSWNEINEKRNIIDKIEALEEYFDFFESNSSKSPSLLRLKSNMTLVAEKLYQIIPPFSHQKTEQISTSRHVSKEMFEI